MGKLLKYLKSYKKESILGPFFKLLEACFELIVPLVMASIIDIGIKNRDMAYILKCGGILVLFGLVGLICSVTAQYFAAKAAAGFGTQLRNDLFRHINFLSYTEIDSIGTATLITRLTSDANQVQSCVNMVLRLFLRSPFIVFGAMVMAFTVDYKAAFIFVIVIPLLMAVVLGIVAATIPLYRKAQNQLDTILLKVRENLNGVRVIRAFNRQEAEDKGFREESNTLQKIQVFVGKMSAVMNPVTYIIINIAIICVLWVGGKEVDIGIITQGAVVALVNYMSQILVELIKFANLIVSITKAFACANRINGIFGETSSVQENAAESILSLKKEDNAADTPVVEFRDVSFSYKNAQKDSLEGITFKAMRGETIGIIGSTGSGKSTLVNLIPRFYDTVKGSIFVDGIAVPDYPLKELREKVGLVPQKAVLFSGSIRENIKWGKPDATDEEIMQALTCAQALSFVNDTKEKLETQLSQGGKNLSGGQKQRLTIARALVKNPKILILDDSSSALDFATDANLRIALREMQSGATIFMVSQRASTIRKADKIIVMEDGGVAGIGTHHELLAACQVYKEICLSQLSKEEVQANA